MVGDTVGGKKFKRVHNPWDDRELIDRFPGENIGPSPKKRLLYSGGSRGTLRNTLTKDWR